MHDQDIFFGFFDPLSGDTEILKILKLAGESALAGTKLLSENKAIAASASSNFRVSGIPKTSYS